MIGQSLIAVYGWFECVPLAWKLAFGTFSIGLQLHSRRPSIKRTPHPFKSSLRTDPPQVSGPTLCLVGHVCDAIWDLGQPCGAQNTHWEPATPISTCCTSCCGQAAVYEVIRCLPCRRNSNMSQAGVTRGTGNTGTASATPLSDARGEPVVSARQDLGC